MHILGDRREQGPHQHVAGQLKGDAGLPGAGVAAQALDESAHRSVMLKRYGLLVGPATASSHHAIRCEHFDLSTQWIFDELLKWPKGGVLLFRPVHVASVATDGSRLIYRVFA